VPASLALLAAIFSFRELSLVVVFEVLIGLALQGRLPVFVTGCRLWLVHSRRQELMR